jgi:hypothetical protein
MSQMYQIGARVSIVSGRGAPGSVTRRPRSRPRCPPPLLQLCVNHSVARLAPWFCRWSQSWRATRSMTTTASCAPLPRRGPNRLSKRHWSTDGGLSIPPSRNASRRRDGLLRIDRPPSPRLEPAAKPLRSPHRGGGVWLSPGRLGEWGAEGSEEIRWFRLAFRQGQVARARTGGYLVERASPCARNCRWCVELHLHDRLGSSERQVGHGRPGVHVQWRWRADVVPRLDGHGRCCHAETGSRARRNGVRIWRNW